MRRKPAKHRHQTSKQWLPIDERIIPQIFSFGHVKGIARSFLILEMVLSIGVVFGTGLLVLLHWVR